MQLPLRPVTFVVVYVLLTALSVEPTVMGWPWSWYYASAGLTAVMAWHCLWAAQLAQTAATPRRSDLVRTLAFAAPGVFAVAVLLNMNRDLYAPASMAAGVGQALTVVVAGSVGAFFVLLWLSARRFCATEREKGGGSLGVFLTFVLALYVVIGAPVLYFRIKRLKGMG
ncbi:hypothetical protein QO010_004793 [Caulobacter ginsengisoli]|uniref:Uncharacterized protein n=1 Tax=Caulobacter ginsengisoli TaxID=400775 RepID=A0ABU0J0B5_9CAUL|nr:hypothetical protein [Caulobacter ginsengisoli]MDQ0466996.1 hypothetical protein [Caulobacter ginsengisoli]